MDLGVFLEQIEGTWVIAPINNTQIWTPKFL